MKIQHISVSRSGVFELCSQQYKYKYHLGLPEEDKPYFNYGKIVHTIIEVYTLAKGKKKIGDITKDVLRGKIELEPGQIAKPLDAEYLKKLPNHLRSFMSLTQQIGTEGKIEWGFLLDLDDPHKRCVKGFIDRLIQKDDKFYIIDYKTSKKGMFRKNRFNITRDLQLQVYCRVVMEVFGAKAENIEAALFYLEGNELVGAKFSKKTLMSIGDRLLATYKRIENMEPEEAYGNVGRHCRQCSFRKLCPFYSLT